MPDVKSLEQFGSVWDEFVLRSLFPNLNVQQFQAVGCDSLCEPEGVY